jgi:hypothetical protein
VPGRGAAEAGGAHHGEADADPADAAGSVSVSHQSGRMEKIGASASTGPTMEMSPRLLARVRR